MKWLNVSSTARASFYVYNTKRRRSVSSSIETNEEFSLMNFNNLDQLYRSVIMDHYKNPRNKGVLDNGSMTVDMNNPTCGDRIRLTFDIEDGIINDAKFEGEGCSISMSSASMMTEAVKGHSLAEAMQMSQEFTKMMLGEDYEITEDMGDIEALQGVSQFPARIKCATLAWKALEKAQSKKKVKQKVLLKKSNLFTKFPSVYLKMNRVNSNYNSCIVFR